jgi:hypothetical protein
VGENRDRESLTGPEGEFESHWQKQLPFCWLKAEPASARSAVMVTQKNTAPSPAGVSWIPQSAHIEEAVETITLSKKLFFFFLFCFFFLIFFGFPEANKNFHWQMKMAMALQILDSDCRL